MQAQAELFGLPESIVPHSIIAFGYPKAESTKQKLIYEEDRVIYYDFFMKYADRLLFGTDTDLTPEAVNHYQVEAFACHLRFIHQLRLPYDELQKVLYQNCERVLGLPPSSSARKHNARP